MSNSDVFEAIGRLADAMAEFTESLKKDKWFPLQLDAARPRWPSAAQAPGLTASRRCLGHAASGGSLTGRQASTGATLGQSLAREDARLMRDTIIVTGSRDFVDLIVLEDAMLRAFSVMGSDRIVHGGARGADSMAETWGHMHGSPSRRIRSTTSSTGRGSGTARVKP